MNKKYTIQDMHKLAVIREGKCISDQYGNYKSNLIWECAEGHQWPAPAGRVIGGSWCPACAGNQPLTINDIQA